MNFKFSTIALMGNPQDPRVVESMRLLTSYLAGKAARVLVADTPAAREAAPSAQPVPEADLPVQAQLIIAIGGDGTMLYAARRAARHQRPLLGINHGRLGFLADVSPGDMLDHLDEILAGRYVSEKRMLLRAQIVAGDAVSPCGVALNDVVVKRHDTGRMLEFQTFIEARYVNTHRGDGLIVATPTGSTAYALSCGGPIVEPGLDAIVLAPICPHTLSDRPIVISAACRTEIQLREGHIDKAEVSCDGEVVGQLTIGSRLQVAVAEERLELIHPSAYDYFQILRSKLRWGRDSRDGPPGKTAH